MLDETRLYQLLDLMAIYISNSLRQLKVDQQIANCNLVLPETRGAKRFSEQEARVLALVYFLQNQRNYPDIKFAFEAPTEQNYIQTGQGTKAWIDLALFEGKERLANVEFKAKQASVENIRKDFEKLLIENYPACFYHYLPDATTQHQRGITEIQKKLHEVFQQKTKSLPTNKKLCELLYKSFRSKLAFYLYELNAHQLYKIVFDSNSRIKSPRDLKLEEMNLR